MEATNKTGGPNCSRTFDKNRLPNTMKPLENGHCGIPSDESEPNDSENNLKGDLTKIFSKVSKKTNIRAQRPTSSNQPGPSSQPDVQTNGAPYGIYYGIKSYLHHFYGPPEKEVLKSGEYMQGDDFKFVAEPHRKACWVRLMLWVGINLLLLGGVAMLVGYLTPPRQAIVGKFEEFTILDRWAVNFNYHLMMCQLVGLITFSFGSIVIVCCLLVASCQSSPGPPAYLVMGAYLPTPTPGKHPENPPTWGIHCIPLSGTLKSVQPQFIQTQY